MRRHRLARTPAPPLKTAKLKRARVARGDPATVEICGEAEKLIKSGWVERRGPFEPRRWPLHEAWGGKEPPEIP